MSEPERLAYDVPGAAAAVSVSPRTIDRAIKATHVSEGIPPLRSVLLGRKRLIDAADLREWFRSLPEG